MVRKKLIMEGILGQNTPVMIVKNMIWQTGRKTLDVGAGGILMGILNVTPDSFSDGGAHMSCEQATVHAMRMIEDGAAIIDIGGESRRPGSENVDEEVEMARVLPVVRAVRAVCGDVLISVDTRKTVVARAVLEAGADIINDIEGMQAPGMAELCAETGCGVVVMHMKGEPKTMQDAPEYDCVVTEVRDFFSERYAALMCAGVREEQICWDPGIGFGKTLEHNLELIARLEELRVAERPILLALSRKRMISTILGELERGRQPYGTAALTMYGDRHGAQIHRVHDVRECADCLKLLRAVEAYEA